MVLELPGGCRRARSSPRRDSSSTLGVVDQVVTAFAARNRLATALGFFAGGVVPVATYLEAHCDIAPGVPLYAQLPTYLVGGGLVFSAKSVFTWAKLAFRDGWKAAGFVVLLEGVMITSSVPVLPLVLLAILVAVNGIATGCTLSLDRAKAAHPDEPIVAPRAAKRASPRKPSRPAPSADHEPTTGIVVLGNGATRTRRVAHGPQRGFSFLESS